MNLRDVRKKTKSISNVKKITQAMELVSAVKMRKAQQAATEAKPYQEFLTKSIQKFTYKLEPKISKLLNPMPNAPKRKLVIVITSNKGLCGAFNFNLIRAIVKNEDLRNCDFVAVGKKGSAQIRQFGGRILADYSTNFPLDNVSALFSFTLEKFLNGEYNDVTVYYNKFISTLKYEPTSHSLLPFQAKAENLEAETNYRYVVEPDPEAIIDPLLKNYLEEKIRFSIVENEAGEHSARMIAMKNATDNATDVISNLTSLGNKLRQQKITYELLDMVTAKESVESS